MGSATILPFSEFRGYESWQLVSIGQDGSLISATVANPAMIKACQSGVRGNGKPFPDGSKLASIHWTPNKDGYVPRGDGARYPA
jgi:hypothetical protein